MYLDLKRVQIRFLDIFLGVLELLLLLFDSLFLISDLCPLVFFVSRMTGDLILQQVARWGLVAEQRKWGCLVT